MTQSVHAKQIRESMASSGWQPCVEALQSNPDQQEPYFVILDTTGAEGQGLEAFYMCAISFDDAVRRFEKKFSHIPNLAKCVLVVIRLIDRTFRYQADPQTLYHYAHSALKKRTDNTVVLKLVMSIDSFHTNGNVAGGFSPQRWFLISGKIKEGSQGGHIGCIEFIPVARKLCYVAGEKFESRVSVTTLRILKKYYAGMYDPDMESRDTIDEDNESVKRILDKIEDILIDEELLKEKYLELKTLMGPAPVLTLAKLQQQD